MKKLFLIPLLLLASAFKSEFPARFIWVDDTTSLQAHLTAGDYTIPPGTYHISGTLHVTHNLEMRGATIISAQTAGAAMAIDANGVSVTNGALQGTWNATDPATGIGNYGMSLAHNNVTISGMTISNFPTYGVSCGVVNNLNFSFNNINTTGFIAFFCNPETNHFGNNSFTNNVIDRSMLPATTILEGGVQIRASNSVATDTTFNWTITGNTINMPHNPHASTNECMELRLHKNSQVSNNTFDGGSIAVSIVASSVMTVSLNTITNPKNEGIEFAVSHHSTSRGNHITSSLNDGFLIDGASPYCYHLRFVKDTVRSVLGSSFHCSPGMHYLQIDSCDFQTPKYGLDLQQTDSVYLKDTRIDAGSHSGSAGILLDQSIGLDSLLRGSILNASTAVQAYNTTSGAVVNHIHGLNVNLTGTPAIKLGTFTNGASFGTDIIFSNLASPLISYLPNVVVATSGIAISSYTPVNIGGTITGYSISPALPAGLGFNTSTGVISGTPTVAHAITIYTITASNGAGNSTATFTLTVNSPIIIITPGPTGGKTVKGPGHKSKVIR